MLPIHIINLILCWGTYFVINFVHKSRKVLLVAVVTPDSSRRYNAPLTLPSCEDKIPRDLLLIYLFFECVFFLRRYSHHDQCNQRVCKLQVHDRPANSSTTLILVIVIFHPSRTICIVLQFFVYVSYAMNRHLLTRHDRYVHQTSLLLSPSSPLKVLDRSAPA